MITVTIQDEGQKKQELPIGGLDSEGNVYGVNQYYLHKNGSAILPIMGEFHFSRFVPEKWKEELLKMRAGGVQIVATYVFWIHHEEREGEWDFYGCRDLHRFLAICNELRMPVWLRIGPWAHGECRNGGFPDWLVKQNEYPLQTDHPKYLEKVRLFYHQIAKQANGMMCKDGGPILGIQIENEYGHCAGPSDSTEGMQHMRTLKKMAMEEGLQGPYYTATGWGGAYVVDGEMLPVLGGYVDAPWAGHTKEVPASGNFLFSPYHMDEIIGADLAEEDKEQSYTFDIRKNPYLTAELGAGLQVTALRRTYPYPEDIEAQTICMLGSGANLIGYYMYHGGTNPEGKDTTLQESIATGYHNDLPIKSYDFQTCIRESGEMNESFGRLKKIHYFIASVEEVLANAKVYLPEVVPSSPEDLDIPRISVRHNEITGEGFLFVNNHQRLRIMKEHHGLTIQIQTPQETFVIENLNVKTGECKIIPYHMHIGRAILLRTNASYLCHVGKRYFFYTDEKPYYEWKSDSADVVTLTVEQANHAYCYEDKLYITDGLLLQDEGNYRLLSKKANNVIRCYGEKGEFKELQLACEEVVAPVECACIQEYDEEGIWYEIKINPCRSEAVHELYLAILFSGDQAQLYQEGRLVADWFSNGEEWHVAMKQLGYPSVLQLKVYPWVEEVYYDLPARKGCSLDEVRVIPEYEFKF